MNATRMEKVKFIQRFFKNIDEYESFYRRNILVGARYESLIWRFLAGNYYRGGGFEDQPMGTRWIAALNYFEIYRAGMGHERGK